MVLLPVDSSMIPLPDSTLGAIVLAKSGRILVPVWEIVRILFPSIIGRVVPVRDHENPLSAYWFENDSIEKYG